MRTIRDTPADLPSPKGKLPECEVITLTDVAGYYGVPYTWLLRRVRAWGIPLLRPNNNLNLMWRDDVINLRQFNRNAS